MATTKVIDILDRASIILQDEAHTRFPNAELLKFFNDAQREVIMHRPDANSVTSTLDCVSGTKQTLPSSALRLLDVHRNIYTVKHTVTVVNAGGNKFAIGSATTPVLTLIRGVVYTFDQSDSSNTSHPIAFKNSAGSSYTTGVVTTGTPGSALAKTVFTVPLDAPSSLRYYCTAHGNSMGATITLSDTTPSVLNAAVTQIERKMLDESLPSWHSSSTNASRGVEHFIYDENTPKIFFVYPGAVFERDALEVSYSSSVGDITISNFSTDTQAISLDDVYGNALLDYVIFLSLIHISEPTRPERIGGGRVGG